MSTEPCILISGGTGLVGRRLIGQLAGPVCLLSRRAPAAAADAVASVAGADSSVAGADSSVAGADSSVAGAALSVAGATRVRVLQWDAASLLRPQVLGPVRAVVHLAGDPVAEGRWTTEKKQRIRDSRVIGTRSLVKSLLQLPQPPEVLVAASAVGFYGHRPGEELTEASVAGSGFLPEVCQEWEAEAQAAELGGIRVVRLRIGIVLDPQGGALGKMLPIFRSGLGGPLGSGRQYFPWIHAADLVGLIQFCLSHSTIRGAVNAVAPTPTTNGQFTQALSRIVRRPAFFPAPKFGLRLVFGEFANSLFDDQRVVPQVALNSGYQFQFQSCEAALRNLLS